MTKFLKIPGIKRILPVLVIVIVLSTSPAWSKDRITMMLIPLQSPSTMYKNFLPLKRHLEKSLGVSIRLKVARKSSDIIKHLEKGDADVAFVCPTLYSVAFKQVPIVPLVKLRIDDVSEYRSVLLVRDDSPVRKTADLVDRTFVYGRYPCPGSGLLPKIMLQRVGITDDDFLEVVRLGSDESALTAVMARMFDATGVPEMVAKPYIGNGLRVLRYSYPIPQYLFVARASLGEDFVQGLRQAMLAVNDLKDRAALLGSIGAGVDGFSEAKDMDYDIVRVLMKNVIGQKDIIPARRRSMKFVVEPVFFEPDLFRRLNPLTSYLSRMTGVNFQLVIPENTERFIQMQKRGEGDLFLQNHHLYTEVAGTAGVRGFATLAGGDNSESNRGIIITHSEGNIKTLQDLKNKRIGITSFYSDDGYLSQRRLLMQGGIKLKALRFVNLKRYGNVIMKVYRGSVDAGFVSYSSLKSMEQDIETDRIRVLAETPPLRAWVIAAGKDMDTGLLNRIRSILVQSSNPGKPEILRDLGIKAFNMPDISE